MKDILSFPRKDAQTLDQAKIVAIDKNKGRVSLFMRNGLISTGTYLYDINDLKVGLSVLVGKINGSYVILNKIVSMPKVSNFLTMRSVISPIGENWNKIYGNDSHPQHFYYLGNDIIISSDIASKQWRSTDRGDTWSINTVTDYPNKENIVDLGNGVLIAIDAIHYHLIRSIDYGVTWDSVLDIPFEGEGVWYYSGDFCDLTNGNIVFYVTYSEAFFSSGYGSNRNLQALSRNYGATWEVKVHTPANGYSGFNFYYYYKSPGSAWGHYVEHVNGSAPSNIVSSGWFVIDVPAWDAYSSITENSGEFSIIIRVSDTVAYRYTSTDQLFVTTDSGHTWVENLTLPKFLVNWINGATFTNFFSSKGTVLMDTGPPYLGTGIRSTVKVSDVRGIYSHSRNHNIFNIEGTLIWLGGSENNDLPKALHKSTTNGLYWKQINNNGHPLLGCIDVLNLGNNEFVVAAQTDYRTGNTEIWKSTINTSPYVPDAPTISVWGLGIAYTKDTGAIHDGYIYLCTTWHISSSLTEPGVGDDWETYWVLMGSCDIWEIGIHFAVSVMELGLLVLCLHEAHIYMSLADHTSSSLTEPGVGANWETCWVLAI